jgi:hypothetical protein
VWAADAALRRRFRVLSLHCAELRA